MDLRGQLLRGGPGGVERGGEVLGHGRQFGWSNDLFNVGLLVVLRVVGRGHTLALQHGLNRGVSPAQETLLLFVGLRGRFSVLVLQMGLELE